MNDTPIGANEFRDAALEALDVIERPCELILAREPLFASVGRLHPDDPATPTDRPPLTYQDRIIPHEEAQNSSRPSSSRHRIIRNPNSNVKLLFIRNISISSEPRGTPPFSEPNSDVARIECSDCGRWDFSNLQGFLNHCRIRHQREYGSHDESIQECSVLVTPSERDWVLQNGTEITGVGIPSLRRLFEIAVGKKTSLFPTPKSELSTDHDALVIEVEEHAVAGEHEMEGTYLSRTLGVHQETPALATILGRRAARRQIRVFSEDELVDIVNTDDPPRPNRKWKMSYFHRNLARPELEVNLELTSDNWSTLSPPIGDAGDGRERGCEVALDTEKLRSTRFHITCRVMVTDRSRWLSPGKPRCLPWVAGWLMRPLRSPQHSEIRSPALPDDTHSWILAVRSPSYVSWPKVCVDEGAEIYPGVRYHEGTFPCYCHLRIRKLPKGTPRAFSSI